MPDPHLGMNTLEADYATYLDVLKSGGLIAEWDFEPERLRIGHTWQSSYKPDFRIVMPDETIEFHETKGFWKTQDRNRVKAAAGQHPYVFRGVMREGEYWAWETFTPGVGDWLD